MKVLLINTNRFKAPVPVIPMGLCYIASFCEKEGHTVKILDLCFSNNIKRDIEKSIKENSWDVVGLGIRNIDDCSIDSKNFFLEEIKIAIVEPLKKVFAGPIVIGGPSVGINACEMLDFFDLNYAIRGDGEFAFLELLNKYDSNDIKNIKGLVVREDGKITVNNMPSFDFDLNKLPYTNPAKYINIDIYSSYNSPLLIQTKRGCALKCSYCTYNRIEGFSYRYRDPELIADDIERLVKETGINRFEFVDSTFNIPLDHAKRVLKAIIKKGLTLRLSTLGLNPGAIDEELAKLLRESGFISCSVGIESASDKALNSLGKNFKVADIKKASKILHKTKLPVEWFLLLGAPDETEDTLKESFKNLRKISSIWDFINIGIGIRVYNGAPVSEIVRKEKFSICEDNFLKPFAFQPGGITLARIKYLTKLEYFRQHNFFIFNERKKPPRLLSSLFKKIFPMLPIWKLYVGSRLLERIVGLLLLKRIFFIVKNSFNSKNKIIEKS